MGASDDAHARRLACQIFTQLPDGQAEALRVLFYVRQIISNFGEERREPHAGEVVRLFSAAVAIDLE